MVTCKYCGEEVGSYGWDKDDNIKCVSCENWEYRFEELEINPELVAFKGFKKGDKVLGIKGIEKGKVGTIVCVDMKRNLFFKAEHYLINFGKDIIGDDLGWCYPDRDDLGWCYPDEVELFKGGK